MLRSYFVIAFRNLVKHRIYTVINVAGLALGLACCVLVILFVQREYAYNRFHEKGDRLYRILRESSQDTWNIRPSVSGALGPALESDFAGVESTVRIWGGRTWLQANDRVFSKGLFVADPNFFEVFTFPLLRGDASTVLREPNGIVISESMALQYFGAEDPIGRTVIVEDLYLGATLTVTGVMADTRPDASWHFWVDCVTSTIGTELGRRIWGRWEHHRMFRPTNVYVLLKPGVDPQTLRDYLPTFLRQHLGEDLARTDGYRLQALSRMHVYAEVDDASSWVIQRIRTYAGIAVGILLLACVNFMNLATARSMLRAREVGMRKTIGARRLQLIGQFLCESTLLALIAAAAGVGLAILLMPTFSSFVGYGTAFDTAGLTAALPWLLLVSLATGLIAGSYPAFALSRAHPLDTIRGEGATGRAGILRRLLVVTQFAVAVFLLVCTAAVSEQIEYLTNRPLGFDASDVIMVPLFQLDRQSKTDPLDRIASRSASIKTAFLQHPDILEASAGRNAPGLSPGLPRKLKPIGREDELFELFVKDGDETFISFFDLKLLKGRNFDTTGNRDTLTYIINETAEKMLGWEDPIGKQLEWVAPGRVMTIVGVVADYQNRSPSRPVAPSAIMPYYALYYDLYLKIRPGRLQDVLPFLEETWKQFLPNRPFGYRVLEEELEHNTWSEREFRRVTRLFGGLAIFLSCLGLYGLAGFTAERRTKEIGIRKVLGASTGSVIGLMSREFATLLGVACLIAWPAAWLYLDDWLNGFAQRVSLSVVPFVLGALAVMVVAAVTISFRTYAAAVADPVDSIRVE